MIEKLEFRVDPQTHFPLVQVPGENFALFWLPLTKVQAEYMLCEWPDSQFDRTWYQARLSGNGRVSPTQVAAANLVQTFLTHILFSEARDFCHWYGPACDLPTSEEWQRALHAFEQTPADSTTLQQILKLQDLDPRARQLVLACANALTSRQRQSAQTNLAQLLQLRPGFMLEYVYADATRNSCGACGGYQSGFQPLRKPLEGGRMINLGLRPIWRLP